MTVIKDDPDSWETVHLWLDLQSKKISLDIIDTARSWCKAMKDKGVCQPAYLEKHYEGKASVFCGVGFAWITKDGYCRAKITQPGLIAVETISGHKKRVSACHVISPDGEILTTNQDLFLSELKSEFQQFPKILGDIA